MTDVHHHLHKRKRVHKKLEVYPHPHSFKRFIDRLIYVVGVVAPLSAIPQVLKIWIEKNADSISLFTFSAHVCINIVWLIYATLHKEKPLLIMYSGWFVINCSIVVGTILYG